MVKHNPTGQQPMPASPEAPGPEKRKPFGASAAPDRGPGETRYDVPAEAADDFAIDEQREKRIRGNEAPKDTHFPDASDLADD